VFDWYLNRICPGRFLAESTLWISMAMILATCKIGKAKDANGMEITPEVEFDSGFVEYVLLSSFGGVVCQTVIFC